MENENYNVVLYYTFCDYLFLSEDVNKEIEMYKNIILNDEFVSYFLGVLDTINDVGGYPEAAINNIKQIILFLENNSENKSNIEQLKKININAFIISNKKYSNENKMKQNSILEYNKNIELSEKDVVESLKYDFLTILSLKAELKDYVEIYMPHFILNRKYIYSVSKILYMFPELLLNEEFKQRIENILNTNQKILEEKNIDTIKLYINQNSLKYKKTKRYLSELDCIEEANMNVLIGINNLELDAFNINDLKVYHKYLMIQSYINGFSNKTDDISLNDIYCYIDRLNIVYKSQKDQLIKLLNIKKGNICDDELQLYNLYLMRVNGLAIASNNKKINDFVNRCSRLDYLKVLHKMLCGSMEEFYDIALSEKNDLYFLETLIKNNNDFDRNIMLFNFKEILYSLKKYMNEYPSLFSNYIIHSRVEKLLQKYQKEYTAKNLTKQLSKIKKV